MAGSGRALRRVALRNIAAHKVRLVLSVVAVVLGVAFVTASFAFTATLKGAFDDIIDNGTEGLAARVDVDPGEQEAAGQAASGDVPGAAAGVPLQALETIRAVPGVAAAQPAISGTAVLMNADGSPHQTGGAPTRGLAWVPADQAVGERHEIVDGRAPEAPGEIALTGAVLDATGLHVGGPARVYTTSRGMVETTVVGSYRAAGAAASSGGYVGIDFSDPQARELFTDGAHTAHVDVAAVPGTGDAELRERLAAALPELRVRTGERVRAEQSEQMATMLDFVNYFFVAFGAVALLVGTFIIYNTFAMLVAQRLRELGLLRALGASRGQVTRSVLGEALVIAVLGAVLGVVAGFGLARVILAVLDALDVGLPASGLRVTTTAVVVPLVLGVVVTMLSAWAPAVRAGRIPPVVALGSGSSGAVGGLVGRTVTGAYLLLVGTALVLIGTWDDQTKPAAVTVGIGAGLLVLGTFLVMPALARPIAGGIGRIVGRPFGAVGRLAALGAGRNSRRTAATAFALTLGLMLVAAFGTLAQSTKASIDGALATGVRAQLIVTGQRDAGESTPLPADLPERLRAVSGVGELTTMLVGGARVGGRTGSVIAADGPVASALDLDMQQGDADPGVDGMVVSSDTARERGWTPGTVVPVMGASGEQFSLVVRGVYAQNDFLGNWYTGRAAYDRLMPENYRTVIAVFVVTAPGAELEQVRHGLEEAVADVPVVTVQDRGQLAAQASGGIDQMLGIVYALLALALVVAVLGIVNTLALSVIERRSEIGMLRAVGMQGAQVRRMIYLESTQIAVFGALLGAGLGVFLGWAFVTVLASKGLEVVSIPWGTVAGVLLGSGVAGVVAAVWPAHRAARTSPLEAITG